MENLIMILEIEKSLKRLEISERWLRWEKKAERSLTLKLRKLFKGIFEKTISKLQEMKSVPSSDILRKPLLFEIENLREKFKEIISDSVIESVNVGRERVVLFADSLATKKEMHFDNLIMKQAIVEIPLTQYSKQFEKLIRDSVFVASEATMDRIMGDVMENLADSYVKGLGIGEASNRLKKVFDYIENYRLERIARTEIQSYQNLGSHRTCIDLGVQYEQWWTAQDERVRSSHAHLHGQIVRTGDRFSNGLMYPGDRSGPIKEWIQCRCRLVPFLMPFGYTAPVGQTYFYETDLVESGLVEEPEPLFYDVDTGFNRHAIREQNDNILDFSQRFRLSEEEIKEKVNEIMRKEVGNSRCAVSIGSENFKKVLEDGRFKSQFETKTSGGFLDNGYRKTIEKNMFGIDPKIEKSDRTIYGFLADDEKNIFYPTRQYGDITCILNKENLINRTTYTWHDSMSLQGKAIPTPLGIPSYEAADMTSDYVIKKFTHKSEIPTTLLSAINSGDGMIGYVETQYHGGLRVEDISEVFVDITSGGNVGFNFDAKVEDWVSRNNVFIDILKNNKIKTILHDGFGKTSSLF